VSCRCCGAQPAAQPLLLQRHARKACGTPLHRRPRPRVRVQALLSQLCMEMLPRIAPLAAGSPEAAVNLCELAGLAAAAADPREAFTTCMECLDAQSR